MFVENIKEDQPASDFPEKRDKLAKRALPEVGPGKKIWLLRLDASRAYFVDSERALWYFNSSARLWREMTPLDVSGIGLQYDVPLEPEKREFDSIEEAALYATKVFYDHQAAILKNISRDPEADPDNREEARKAAQLCSEIVQAIVELEKEKDPEEKRGLTEKLQDLLGQDSIPEQAGE